MHEKRAMEKYGITDSEFKDIDECIIKLCSCSDTYTYKEVWFLLEAMFYANGGYENEKSKN